MGLHAERDKFKDLVEQGQTTVGVVYTDGKMLPPLSSGDQEFWECMSLGCALICWRFLRADWVTD
jgi:hypothetical protein